MSVTVVIQQKSDLPLNHFIKKFAILELFFFINIEISLLLYDWNELNE